MKKSLTDLSGSTYDQLRGEMSQIFASFRTLVVGEAAVLIAILGTIFSVETSPRAKLLLGCIALLMILAITRLGTRWHIQAMRMGSFIVEGIERPRYLEARQYGRVDVSQTWMLAHRAESLMKLEGTWQRRGRRGGYGAAIGRFTSGVDLKAFYRHQLTVIFTAMGLGMLYVRPWRCTPTLDYVCLLNVKPEETTGEPLIGVVFLFLLVVTIIYNGVGLLLVEPAKEWTRTRWKAFLEDPNRYIDAYLGIQCAYSADPQTKIEISSAVVAIPVPFSRTDTIDFDALGAYLDVIRQNGVRAILVNGTTGEFASLSDAERVAVTRFCRSTFPGTIITNISSSSAATARALYRLSEEHTDAVTLLPPFYFHGAERDGVERFFADVLTVVDRPLFIYNYPKNTGFSVRPGLLKNLQGRFPQVVGIKDSSGDIGSIADFRKLGADFQVYSGSDSLAKAAMQLGANGFVSGAASPFPRAVTALGKAWDAGDADALTRATATLSVWTELRRKNPGHDIALAKAAIHQRVPEFSPWVRAPLLGIDARLLSTVKQTLQELEKALDALHSTDEPFAQ